jgi:cob(I)alamin adenosyltransferase
MRIYTRTGDAGQTGLFGGPRVFKDDPRIEAYGAVDELNAFLGLARAEALPAEIESCLARVQNELFAVGAELATPDPQAKGTALASDACIAAIERAIDALEADLPPLQQFILPAGARSACALHAARGICRRAERRLISLVRQSQAPVSHRLIQYLNRLGDYLFVAARAANASAGIRDVPWSKPE